MKTKLKERNLRQTFDQLAEPELTDIIDQAIDDLISEQVEVVPQQQELEFPLALEEAEDESNNARDEDMGHISERRDEA